MRQFLRNIAVRLREWQIARRDRRTGEGLDVSGRLRGELRDQLRRDVREELRERRRHQGNGRMRW